MIRNYPTRAVSVPLSAQIFSPLTWEQARKGVPEIKVISKKEEEIAYIGEKKTLIDQRFWQESPSRIIFHDGKYHTWIMHLKLWKDKNQEIEPENYYLTSVDGYRWNVEGEFPNGEPGSFDDFRREGLQVVAFAGRFWMFYSGNAKNGERYGNDKRAGNRRNGIACWLLIGSGDPGKEPQIDRCSADRKIRKPGIMTWSTTLIRFISMGNGSSTISPEIKNGPVPGPHCRGWPWPSL